MVMDGCYVQHHVQGLCGMTGHDVRTLVCEQCGTERSMDSNLLLQWFGLSIQVLAICHGLATDTGSMMVHDVGLVSAESVAERSEAVNSKLQLRRDQIEELSQVKNLLTKLQVVFDLPRRLRAALDRGAHEIAADAYADAAPLLKRYGHKVGAASTHDAAFRTCG